MQGSSGRHLGLCTHADVMQLKSLKETDAAQEMEQKAESSSQTQILIRRFFDSKHHLTIKILNS